ncbi:MAG TPA: nitroreductase family protein [Paludibacter sp.]|nr:nitroreductase family protein [Paludibacter sp.]
MAIPTTRAKEESIIRIDDKNCNGCGACVSVCKDFNFRIIDGKVAKTNTPAFGCVGCGHCMMICPSNVIAIEGRSLSPLELFKLPSKESVPGYDSLLAMLQRRRSIREFDDRPVEQEKINQILEAAQTAPMGIPPSDVHVVVLENQPQVRRFTEEFSNYLESIRWMASNWFLALMRPFWGKANDEMMHKFVGPLFNVYVEDMKSGNNWITYDAPLAMYFYGSPYSDPADPIIAATYAMIAGESLGLGSCMLGGIHPFIQHGKKARRFRERWGVKYPSREGLMVIFGYSKVHYKRGVKRTFADVRRFC